MNPDNQQPSVNGNQPQPVGPEAAPAPQQSVDGVSTPNEVPQSAAMPSPGAEGASAEPLAPVGDSSAQSQPISPTTPPSVQGGTPVATHQQTDTLGIVSIILAFFFPLVGLIVGLVGSSKAKKEGYDGKLSKVGTILSAVFMILSTLFLIMYFVLFAAAVTSTEVQTNTFDDSTFESSSLQD